MKTHILKLNEQFCEQVNCGIKTFEIRKNDRDFRVGDRIKFKAVNDAGEHIYHPINNKEFIISYILSGWGLQDGYVAMSIERLGIRHEKA